MHTNYVTRKEYQGGNQAELDGFRRRRGYHSWEWMTYRQALGVGRQVRKGEHGCRIVKVNEVEEHKDGQRRRIAKARNYTVFNLEQTDQANREGAA
jgi:antirestriction protein ArdC